IGSGRSTRWFGPLPTDGTAPTRSGSFDPDVEVLESLSSNSKGDERVDSAYVARFLERSEYESTRTAPPDGFPKLPDLPLGRYTDPEFYVLEQQYLWKRSWLY